ncbi:hypothetical protein CJU89_6108 [Yarrowia sp. B02]|nr:hypothetical protein CJU89_6108 [Yarrowia sp. B02]
MCTALCDSKPVIQSDFCYTSIDEEMAQYFADNLWEGCGFKQVRLSKDTDKLLLQGIQLIPKALVIYAHDRQQIIA